MKLLVYLLITLLLAQSQSGFVCSICQTTMSAMSKALTFITPTYAAVEFLQALCIRRYDSQNLCRKVAQEIAPLAISNLINNYLRPEKRCSRFCNNSFVYYDIEKQVERILSGGEFEYMNMSAFVNFKQHKLQAKEQIKILQISDIHLDHDYTQKASTSCQFPICCHPEHGFPQNSNAQAKKYGDKNCDSPPELLYSFLSYIKNKEQIDMILLTGDISAHNQWEKTSEMIESTNKYVQNLLNKKFPSSLIIRSEGNNDYAPDHQFDPSFNPKLIEVYHVFVGQSKLTFISLNSIVFDQMNLFLLGDQSYIIFQLRLLESLLKDPQNQNIYLMGHIPITMSGTILDYATVFRSLVAKFSDKIKGQFYGHTHSDQLAINTYPKTLQITGFAFVCPSLSPLYIGSSRSRVYTVDVKIDGGVIDYHQYILKDLTADKAEWKLQYRFRQKFQIRSEKNNGSISLSDVLEIKNRIFSDKHYQKMYITLSFLSEERGKRLYCNLIDDVHLKKLCLKKSVSIFQRFINILSLLRGRWGYRKSLLT